MKNSTLIRIKVPKALYESALRKALLEASDKATPEKVKASIQKQEKDHNKKTDDMIAKARAAKAKTGVKEASDKEQITGKGAKKGSDVAYSAKAIGTKAPKSKEPMVAGKKASTYNDSTYSKKVGTKSIKEETNDTDGIADSKFGPAKSERDMEKDSQNLGEKKKHMEESSLMQTFQSLKDLTPFLIPLAGFLGLSVAIVKNMFKYMKDNNLKGMKGFIEAYNTVGKGVSGQQDRSRGINEAKKKVDPKKAAEEKKKKEAEDKKKK